MLDKKKINRYEIDGTIRKDCPICSETKELICYTDKLTGKSENACRSCIEDIIGIKIIK